MPPPSCVGPFASGPAASHSRCACSRTNDSFVKLGDFERAYRDLLQAGRARRDNFACVECSGCVGCHSCTFCRDSESLTRSSYCVRSKRLTDCSHCHDAQNLIGCHHCQLSEDCSSSSYLVRCVGLSGCSYCFGCVGLSGKDFHILNEPYERAEYFKLTQALLRELKRG